MVGYGRHRSRQQGTRQQPDRRIETSQGKELHTHRNKSELHFMAGHTMLSVPLASILSIEKLVLRDIQTTEYEIITKESGTITLDVV